MTLFDAEWIAEFGPIPWVEPCDPLQAAQHFEDLDFEMCLRRGKVRLLVETARRQPRSDRGWALTRTDRMLAQIEQRRQQHRVAVDRRKADAVRWMQARGWRADDICNRLHITVGELQQLLREAS